MSPTSYQTAPPRTTIVAYGGVPVNVRQLPDLAGHLKGDLTIHELKRRSRLETDTAAASRMQAAKEKLFTSFEPRRSA